jgi:hypothetical protein
MPRKVRLRTSRGASPHEQSPRYGLRKRTAHGTVPDGKNLQGTKHDNLARETKRARTNTRNHLSASTGSLKNSARASSVQGRVKRNKNKLWLAEAIRKENDTQYLIEYKPIRKGAQSEISWQPKRYANAALLREWEEHKMAVAHDNCNADNDPDSMFKDDETGQRSDFVGRGHQDSAANLPSQEPCNAHLESCEQHTIDFVNKRTLAGFGNSPEDTLLTATSTIVPEDLGFHTHESKAAAEMHDNHKNRGLHDSSAVALSTLEKGSAPPPCGLSIHNHGPSEGDTVDCNLGKPTPRPGTSISTILSPAPCLSDDNKDDESSTFVGRRSSQALPSVNRGQSPQKS